MHVFRLVALVPTVAVLFLLLSVCAGGAVYAQEDGIAIKLIPSTIEEQLDPGGVAGGVLTVTNESGGVQTYYLKTRNIDGMTESGRPLFSNDSADDPVRLASWITVGMEQVQLGVGESQEVPFTIVVPEDASPGSYAASIFVTRQAEVTSESGAGIGFDVGSLVLLRVSGDVIEDMKLLEFSTDRSVYTEPDVSFTARIENIGTVHQRPVGVIAITDMLGNEIGAAEVNTENSGVFRDAERVFTTTWNAERFTLGRYTAVLSMVYGEGSQRNTVSRTTTFWVIPVKEVGMVVGGLLLLTVFVFLLLRAYVRRQIKAAGVSRQKSEPTQVTFARRMMRTLVRVAVLLVVVFVVFLVLNA